MESSDKNWISNFVKHNRNKLRMTQEELAAKAGVGLRFIRELEQGKETLRLDKINQVLALFGQSAVPGNAKLLDPYDILINHFHKNVQLSLRNKTTLMPGFIIGEVYENNEIKSWRFVPNNKAKEFQKTQDEKLVQEIMHADIEGIQNI